jgi:hypothetical protein
VKEELKGGEHRVKGGSGRKGLGQERGGGGGRSLGQTWGTPKGRGSSTP